MELAARYIFSEVEIVDIKFGIYLFVAAATPDIAIVGSDWATFKKLSGF